MSVTTGCQMEMPAQAWHWPPCSRSSSVLSAAPRGLRRNRLAETKHRCSHLLAIAGPRLRSLSLPDLATLLTLEVNLGIGTVALSPRSLGFRSEPRSR